MGNGAGATFCRRRRSQAPAGSQLEKVCGRAALLAGDVEGYAGACLGLRFDGGMADNPGEDEGRSLEGQVAVPGRCDNRGVAGAVLRNRRQVDPGVGGICRLRHSRAMMCAVSSAARRQICVGAGCEGQHRRDQRKAEEEKQREAEDTSHSAIVTIFVRRCVRDLLFAHMGELNPGEEKAMKKSDGAKAMGGPEPKPQDLPCFVVRRKPHA
jgi:hypothetical protein